MNFHITVSNGLLKDGHRKRMGEAVWEFMWLLDKITKVDGRGLGWVLGGKPIKLVEIAKQLGVSEMTVSRNLQKLSEQGYITHIRTPYGISIRVAKAQKRFNKNVRKSKEESNENVESPNENVDSPNENVESNKDTTVDTTVDKTTNVVGRKRPKARKGELDHILNHLRSKISVLDGSKQLNRQYAWLVLNKFNYGTDPPGAVMRVLKLIDMVFSNEYHKTRCTGMKYLFDNTASILNSQITQLPMKTYG